MADSQKQTVQWFPGHMAKTRRLIKESLPLVDCVTELLDARVPLSSRNPELDELTQKKPRIVLLNKCDMADERTTREWIEYFKRHGQTAIAVDCRSGKGLSQYHSLVRRVLADKIKSNTEKGMPGKALRVMVVGIPNTGKSSFINRMAKKSRAQVADRPGVTRHNQWFAIGNGIELLDTPGILWPKFEDQKVGMRLAFIGSINDEILQIEELSLDLIAFLQAEYPGRLSERFEVDEKQAPLDVLIEISRRRRCFLKGEEPDLRKASAILIDEFRGGKLGGITLELPEDGGTYEENH